MQLEGKVALITGGGAGIGEGVARRFVAEGARVCITDVRREALDQVVASLPEGSVVSCVGDVSDPADVKQMVETTLSLEGRLDVLVNNAGVTFSGNVVDLELATWRRVIDVNLTGPFLMMKQAIPHMIKAGGGSIINMSSLGGIVCSPGSPAYSATKAGLIHLTKEVALDFGKYRIRCNAVCPGPVRTGLLDGVVAPMAELLHTDLDDVYARLSKNSALARVSTPQEIAGLCVYLAGDDSTFMTGSAIMIDGGTCFVDVFAATVGELGLDFA